MLNQYITTHFCPDEFFINQSFGLALVVNIKLVRDSRRVNEASGPLLLCFTLFHPSLSFIHILSSFLSSLYNILCFILLALFTELFSFLFLLYLLAHPADAEEVENLLSYNLPPLCCRVSDWPSLLRDAPGLQLCEYKGPRATQYCLVIMLHLALQQGDR